MNILSRQRDRGFALPVVIITSVVMMVVLLSSVSVSSSVTTSLQNQYYQRLASEAATSGLAYLNSCVYRYGNAADWVTLYPGASCTESATSNPCNNVLGGSCQTANQLLSDGRVRSTFEVSSITYDGLGVGTFVVIGTVHVTKTSDNSQVIDTVRVYKKGRILRDGTNIDLTIF